MIRWGMSFRYAYGDDVPPPQAEKKIPLQCPHCGIHTEAEIVSRFMTEQNDFIRLPEFEMKLYNFFLRCTRCNGAILLLRSYGEDAYRKGVTAGQIVFPFYSEAFEAKELGKDVVPEAILADVAQAELCSYSGAYLGAGLLLRRSCQNICKHKGCSDASGLASQVKELVGKGVITQDMSELVDTIRIIGNEIAHPDPNTPFVITRDDVKACREFIKQLLQVIYVNPHKARLLKEQLSKKGVK